ncbi:MAG TPA: MarR family transcriptional regulator [Fimbriimonas sp.]|nr:MarR family transcriptional regulator [Fimbriimonas sp.]
MNWNQVTQFRAPEQSPGLLLWQITNRWQRSVRAALAPFGLTHVQFVLLACLAWALDHDGGPISQRELADRAGTDPMMTSQVVRALIESGLMNREPHNGDRRAFALGISRDGREKVRLAVPAVEGADRAFFDENRTELERLQSLVAAGEKRP